MTGRTACALILAASLAAGTVWQAGGLFGAGGRPGTLDELLEIAAQGRELDAQMESRARFVARVDAVLDEVGRGRLGLGEACDLIHDLAAVEHPRFLRDLEVHGEGTTLRMKIAQNVMAHFRHNPPGNSDGITGAEVLRRLEEELDALARRG